MPLIRVSPKPDDVTIPHYYILRFHLIACEFHHTLRNFTCWRILCFIICFVVSVSLKIIISVFQMLMSVSVSLSGLYNVVSDNFLSMSSQFYLSSKMVNFRLLQQLCNSAKVLRQPFSYKRVLRVTGNQRSSLLKC